MCGTEFYTGWSSAKTCSAKCRTALHRARQRPKVIAVKACNALDQLFAVAELGHKNAKALLRDIRDGVEKMLQELGA